MNKTDLNGIRWSLAAIHSNRDLYVHFQNYYEGKHRLQFATEKFKNTFSNMFYAFADNQCSMVIDTIADRLQLEGFRVVDADDTAPETPVERTIQEVWRRNRMKRQSGIVHASTLTQGNYYIIVEKNPDGLATMHLHDATKCVVMYDPSFPGLIIKACKWWLETISDGRYVVRLNVYYPDRTEKFVSTPTSGEQDLPYTDASFQPIALDPVIPNEYGKVPVFHFSNNAPVGLLGKSELVDVIPLQDALNKSSLDMLVAMEFHAFPQRWAAGIGLDIDADGNRVNPFTGGVERIWAVEDKDVKFGQFDTANPSNYIQIQDAFRSSISRVSGIPQHFFGVNNSGGWPSGEAMKTAESRLTSKVKDRQISWGDTWSDVMRYCLKLEGFEHIEVEPLWTDTAYRSETESINNALNKLKAGVPFETIWRELGYSATDVQQFLEELKASQEATQQASQQPFTDQTPNNQ